MNILIVDDKYENRYLLETVLKGNGFDVRLATNGAEALEIINSEEIGMIISDILMPVMDGFELCRRIKTDDKFKDIHFIIYTATYTGPQDEAFAIKIGANRFIVKPCEPDVFIKAVHDVISADKHGIITAVQDDTTEKEILKLYNERLVRKLEKKMLELEKEVQARNHAEKTLKESEEKYRSLYNSIRDAILVTTKEYKIIDCNPAFIDLFGYTIEEISGEEARIIYKDETEFNKIVTAINNKDNITLQYSIDLKKKNRTVFPGEFGIFYLHNSDGELAGFIILIRDITDRQQAERVQKTLEAQLYQAQKIESIGRLAGGIAHDFNTMLSIILASSNSVMKSLGEEHPQYIKLNHIHQAGVRADSLTKQLLAFSRNQLFEIIIIDVNTVILEFEKFIQYLIGKNITLELALYTEPLMVKADITQLEQVIMNLAINARDAMTDGGILKIETRIVKPEDNPAEKTPDIAPCQHVLIKVSDTGCGMDEKTMSQIFEPFFTTKQADKGTGLGLATSHGIIKQHGGEIFVSSEPGKGSSFSIFLPLLDV